MCEKVYDKISSCLANDVSCPIEDFEVETPEESDYLHVFARDERVDLGDVFVCLDQSSNKCLVDVPNNDLLLGLMGYEKKVPDNVQRTFKVVTLSDGLEIGTIKFSFLGDKKRPTIVLGTGLWHSMGVIDEFAMKLASKLECDVVIYDIPSMGSSQLRPNNAVTQDEMSEAVVKTIESNVVVGESVVPVAFSMSTFGQRALVKSECDGEICDVSMPELEEKGYVIPKMIFINPTRSYGESFAGKSYDTWIYRGMAGQILTRWGDLKAFSLDVFFDSKTNVEATKLVQREVARISLFGFMELMFKNDFNALIGESVGKSEKIRVIFSEDKLMPNDDLQGRGIIRVAGPHSAIVDPKYHEEMITAFKEAIDGSLKRNQDVLTSFDIQTGIAFNATAGIGYRNGHGLVELSPEIQFRLPFVKAGIGASAGLEFDSKMAGLGLYLFGNLEISHPDLWVSLYGEARKGFIQTNKTNWQPVALESGVSIHPWNLLDIRGGIVIPLEGDNQFSPGMAVSLNLSI